MREEIPKHLHEKVHRMYKVGHPPGVIASVLGYQRVEVLKVLDLLEED